MSTSSQTVPNATDAPAVRLTAATLSPRTRWMHRLLLATAVAYLLWSGLFPKDRFNWLMEVAPALIGGIVLLATYRRFAFTTLTYTLIWFFSLILMTGGHYTYAQVPIGDWVRDVFHLARNDFDRFGHFFQGVIPAMVGRELLLRTSRIGRSWWLPVLCIAVALAISAGYELFEWRYAVTFGGHKASEFLGSQGDIWDAQQDMAMALLGAITAMLTLSHWQSRQMRG